MTNQTMTTAETILKKNAFKLTKQRHALLVYLLDHQHRYTEVTEVDQYMRTEFPGMSHNTIYRNLKEFASVGIVEQQQNGDHACVKYQCDFANQHHHHFICQNCGMVTELEMCPMDFFEAQLPGAKISGHRFEMYGLCADCASLEEA